MLVPIASQRALLSYLILTFLFLFAFFTSQTPYHLFDRAATHRWMNAATDHNSGIPSSSSSDVIAIDIALLPPQQHTLTVAVQQYNAILNESFHFDHSHYAHLTLIQMYMKRDRLPELVDEIQKLLSQIYNNNINNNKALVLTATTIQIDATPSPTGSYGTMMLVSKTDALSTLQSALHTLVISYQIRTQGDTTNFYTEGTSSLDTTINPSTKTYVANFEMSSSLQSYLPHITIGFASDRSEVERLQASERQMLKQLGSTGYGDWIPDRLYIFQLGNHGTCRKQLAEIKFN